MIPGRAQQTAAGSHEPQLDSPFLDGIFSHKKAQLFRDGFAGAEEMPGLSKGLSRRRCLSAGSLETNAGVGMCSQEVCIRVGSWETHWKEERKAGLGWAEGEADLQYGIKGFSQSYQRFGAGKASHGS